MEKQTNSNLGSIVEEELENLGFKPGGTLDNPFAVKITKYDQQEEIEYRKERMPIKAYCENNGVLAVSTEEGDVYALNLDKVINHNKVYKTLEKLGLKENLFACHIQTNAGWEGLT